MPLFTCRPFPPGRRRGRRPSSRGARSPWGAALFLGSSDPSPESPVGKNPSTRHGAGSPRSPAALPPHLPLGSDGLGRALSGRCPPSVSLGVRGSGKPGGAETLGRGAESPDRNPKARPSGDKTPLGSGRLGNSLRGSPRPRPLLKPAVDLGGSPADRARPDPQRQGKSPVRINR